MKLQYFKIAFLFLLLILSILFSCANPRPPSGGALDTTKPKVIQNIPRNMEKNFAGDGIYIRFNKWMDRNSVVNNISFNPPIKYEWEWSGKSLKIFFNEPLDSNSTYFFLIGSEIVDLDGNYAESPFSLSFTRGSKIDSGRIFGKILERDLKNAFIYAIPLDILSDTVSNIENLLHYKVKSNVLGDFQFQALKNNDYLLVAYLDKNNNKIFDLNIDPSGIASKPYKASSYSLDTIYILLQPPLDWQRPSLIDIQVKSGNHIDLIFDEIVRIDTSLIFNIKLTQSNGSINIPNFAIIPDSQSNVCQLFFKTPLDSGEFTLEIADSNVFKDIAGNLLSYPKKMKLHNFKGLDTSIARIIKPTKNRQISLVNENYFHFFFTKPIDPVRTRRISVSAINMTTKDTLFPQLFYDAIGLSIEKKNFRWGNSYRVEIYFDTLFDFVENKFEKITDTLILDIMPSPNFGSLRGTFRNLSDTTTRNYTVMLYNSSNRFYSQVQNGIWQFEEIPVGEYSLLIFDDRNGNGKYDFGQLFPLLFSEEILKYFGTFSIQKGWIIEQINLWK
ncbi:MAG: Ig-like domain-containing protein [Candidatus Kapaibacteriales bacterium]